MSTSTLLEIQQVHFSYSPEVPILQDVNLKVASGETLALLGSSGSGKSTLLRLIAGLEQPDSGAIILDGQDITHRPTEKRGIGLLFQDYNLFPHLRILDNVAFGLSGPKKERQQAAMNMLAQAKLDHYAKRYPHQISGGEQQRVALLRALILSPRLMLLDEPFSNLDIKTREETRERTFATLKERNIPLIMVTHDPAEAQASVERIIQMASINRCSTEH